MRLVIEAEDFEEAVTFYRDALGMEEEFYVESDGGAMVTALSAGRATLEIVNPAQRRLIDQLEVGREVSRSIRVAFEVADADSVTDQLVAAGAELIASPTNTPRRSLSPEKVYKQHESPLKPAQGWVDHESELPSVAI